MAEINLSNVQFYRKGLVVSADSTVVGNDWVSGAVATRVARYTIIAPPEGAMGFKLYFKASYLGDSGQSKKIPIRYYVGTSDSSHVNANHTYEYTGEFTLNSTTLEFTAENEMMLFPGQTYYLWLFPASNDYGWYFWGNKDLSSMKTLGGLGLVYIQTGSGFEAYSAHIGNGQSWDRCAPYVGNGTSWDMYS